MLLLAPRALRALGLAIVVSALMGLGTGGGPAFAASVTAHGGGTAATRATAEQGRYLYLWNHDANFSAAQCAYLPNSLHAACAVAVRAQLANPQTVHETMAESLHYLALFQHTPTFATSLCALLPARFVAPCLARAPSAAASTVQCTGVSGTVCQAAPSPATSPAGAAGTGTSSAATTPATSGSGASPRPAPPAVQQRYLYYWTHDANFKAQQCDLLPPSLWSACQVAVRVQLQKSPVAKESMAERQHYAQLFEQGAHFSAAECAYLPAQYVASCVAQPGGAPHFTLHCTGASGTVCRFGQPLSAPSSGAGSGAQTTVAMVLGQSSTPGTTSGVYPGVMLHFPTDPTQGLAPMSCPLQATGPTLVFSDGPEQVPGPGILYQDTVSGKVRVYLYHVNDSPSPLHIGALLTNQGSAPITIYLTRQGVAGPSSDFVAVGKQAEHIWFEPMEQQQFTLMPGGSFFLGNLVQHAVAKGQAVNGIYDFLTTAPVQVSVVAETQPAASTAGLSVLPSTVLNAAGTPMRGTFTGADLTCTASETVPGSGRMMFSFGQGGNTGSFLVGTSAVDGGARVVDYGNYGVLYQVNLSLTSSSSSRYDSYAVMLHPRGGPFAGTSVTTGGVGNPGVVPLPYNQPFVSQANDAVLMGIYQLHPVAVTVADMSWMSAASTSLPIDLLIYPVN